MKAMEFGGKFRFPGNGSPGLVKFLGSAALALGLMGSGPSLGQTPEAAPRVVASIGPLHSLVSAVMEGVGTPYLLMERTSSPHDYTMTPADARALSRADVVVWVGEALETALIRPITALAQDAKVLEVLDMAGVEILPGREGGVWEAHGSEEQEHEAQGHGAEGIDGHVWLDPRNAIALSRGIAETLREIDPVNADRYRTNAAALADRLLDLEHELAGVLAPVRAKPYVVFHDAYHYFERRFAMNAVGAITIDPARAPGAKRLSEIRAHLRRTGAFCVFAEPQFEPALARTVVEGTKAGIAVLDPLGADIASGPEAYFSLLRRMAGSLRDCLSAAS